MDPLNWQPETKFMGLWVTNTRATPSCVLADWTKNPLTYRYTIGMVAWNLTPRAAAVYSGPVRIRLEMSQARGPEPRTLDLFGPWISGPLTWLALSSCCVGFSQNNHQDSQICSDSTNPQEVRFCLAQQSLLPSIPKSGLTTPCKDWVIWDWGLDLDRRPHVLLDPSEDDVITGERRRDKEILLRRQDCFSDPSYHVFIRSCYCEKLNRT